VEDTVEGSVLVEAFLMKILRRREEGILLRKQTRLGLIFLFERGFM